MKTSKARKNFKSKFGQTNHFLITCLVGLDAIREKIITEKSDSFSTSWNPKSPVRSAERSREFVLKSFLATTVDAIDMYLCEIFKWREHLTNKEIVKIYDSNGRSIWNKATKLGDYYELEKPLTELVEILITWRNNVVHFNVQNMVRDETKETIKDYSDSIIEEFRGMDASNIVEKAEKGLAFSFKEAASLIHAAHEFVMKLDEKIISDIDIEGLCIKTVENQLKEEKFFLKYHRKQGKDRNNLIDNFLHNTIGIDHVPDEILLACSTIPKKKKK